MCCLNFVILLHLTQIIIVIYFAQKGLFVGVYVDTKQCDFYFK